MLVLSRKVNEQIVIGDNVRVTVVSIRGNQIRLGFEAAAGGPDLPRGVASGPCHSSLSFRVRRRDSRGGRLFHSLAREWPRLSPLDRACPLQGNAVGDEMERESAPESPRPGARESQFAEMIRPMNATSISRTEGPRKSQSATSSISRRPASGIVPARTSCSSTAAVAGRKFGPGRGEHQRE